MHGTSPAATVEEDLQAIGRQRRTGGDRPGGLSVRNVRIGRRRTSVSLEVEFWDALHEIAKGRSLSLNEICALADAQRGDGQSFTSALRTYALTYYAERVRAIRRTAADSAKERPH